MTKDALQTLWDCILTKLSTKVDVVSGKGLSTNDFTDNYKEILDNGSYIPQRGIDYWTTEDINTIKGYVDDAISNGSW